MDDSGAREGDTAGVLVPIRHRGRVPTTSLMGGTSEDCSRTPAQEPRICSPSGKLFSLDVVLLTFPAHSPLRVEVA